MTVVALGADHAGFLLKQDLKQWLVAEGYTVVDAGTHSEASVDYPDFAAAVSRAVSRGEAERGVLVCGTGIGMAIAANKVPGIRAGVCRDVETARLSRQHNDLNVLALAGRATSRDHAIAIVSVWLQTAFEGGRHERRLLKVAGLEKSGLGGPDLCGPHVQGEVAGAPAR
jgi:RpiB/LacA/LacB family sugar-phosphate isomerase